MVALFAAAVFLSAWLLFTVQPMAAKWLLPSLGGSPSVWIACMLFFQAALVAGYGYAHLLTRLRRPRVQMALHAVLVLTAAALVPVNLDISADEPALAPISWLLRTLAAGLGLPLLVLCASGPLLQSWYSLSGRRDPYSLYAASNLGSLGALLAYPLLLEPRLPLHGPPGLTSQSSLWALTFWSFGGLTLACAATLVTRPAPPGRLTESGATHVVWRDRMVWMALAAVPSSAMLGTTQVITSDI